MSTTQTSIDAGMTHVCDYTDYYANRDMRHGNRPKTYQVYATTESAKRVREIIGAAEEFGSQHIDDVAAQVRREGGMVAV
jgi:hypothetical protein